MKQIILTIFGVSLVLISCGSTSTGTTTAKPAPVSASAKTTENITKGKTVYEENCSKCHALPTVTAFTDEKWIGIMDWMAPKAKLTDEQKALAYLYVSSSN